MLIIQVQGGRGFDPQGNRDAKLSGVTETQQLLLGLQMLLSQYIAVITDSRACEVEN